VKEPEIKELDFSQFHPLMHRPFSRECFGWYGGPTRHIELWWDYQRPDPIGAVLCRLGRHDMTPYWRGMGSGPWTKDNATGLMCRRHCGKREGDEPTEQPPLAE